MTLNLSNNKKIEKKVNVVNYRVCPNMKLHCVNDKHFQIDLTLTFDIQI